MSLYRTPVAGARIRYNGIDFSPTADTVEFRATPVYDSAGRTVVHTVFSLTIVDVIVGRPADATTEGVLSALLIPAAGFVYTGRGIGGVRINTVRGGKSDMVWGPRPRSAVCEPLAGGNAVKLTWSVEFATLNCGDARTLPGGVAEFNYRLSFDIDKSGYTKRVYSGFVRVAATRLDVKDRRVLVSADAYREQINPPLLPGYRRTPGAFNLSEDKARLDFSITDEMMPPNVPPPGVIEASARHNYTSVPGQLLAGSYNGTIFATYEVARGYPVSVAWNAFGLLVRDRVGQIVGRPAGGVAGAIGGAIAGGAAAAAGYAGRAIIPLQFTAEEVNAYDKTMVQLGITYKVIGMSLSQILSSGGLWRPVPGSNWLVWAASLPASLHPRGLSQLGFRLGDDAIVDLCGPVEARIPPTPVPVTLIRQPARTVELRGGPGLPLPVELKREFPRPPKEVSFLKFVNALTIEDDHGNVVVKTLPPSSLVAGDTTGAWDATLSTVSATRESTPFPPASDVKPTGGSGGGTPAADTAAQQRVTPTLYVTMVGECLRVGYPVPVPELVSIGGKTPVLCNRADMGEGFTQAVVGSAQDPIYGAVWRLRYCLTDPPKGALPVLPSPLVPGESLG